MSERNVELMRRSVEAVNTHDIEALIALADPSIELHSLLAGAVSGTVYHGHDGMRSWWHRDLVEVWGDGLRIEPNAYFDLGEYTLLFAVLHGRGLQSGVEIAMPYAVVTRWREDVGVYLKMYAHREDALNDLGVSEDELEPIEP